MAPDRFLDLKIKLTQLDQAIKNFSDEYPNEFSIHLDFPSARFQQAEGVKAGGYQKETLSLTALAITCLNHLEDSSREKYLQQLAEITPKLEQDIKNLLAALQQSKANKLYDDIEKTCGDIVFQLNFLTKKNQLAEKKKPKPNQPSRDR
jgi:hypothetical protein